MFGISLTEIALIAMIALIVVGPQKLPTMLRTVGTWMRKLRRLTTEVRAQTGIDDLLRQEGFDGGLSELRGILRGDIQARRAREQAAVEDPYKESVELDLTREYPLEGADARGALPDDLVDEEDEDPPPAPSEANAALPAAAEPPASQSSAPPWAERSAKEPANATPADDATGDEVARPERTSSPDDTEPSRA